ncbi:MAG: methyltransferase domain-containing protein [Actinomycetota bacterium]|nr:methyltransferase domain-containing protein [Actinomycetota bacterium]
MSAVRRSSDRSPVRWGFHRLDDRTARYVVDRAGICETDLVVDLGAGTGALTAALVRAGARVIAVELHPGRAAQLDRRFGANLYVTVVRADLRQVGLPREPYRVVANPPWKLADAVCDRLRRSPSLLRADLVLPRWMVDRWIRRYPGIQAGPSIRAEAFSPPAPYGARVAVLTGPAIRGRSLRT